MVPIKPIWCRLQEIIITILSGRDYIQALYSKLLFIKTMAKLVSNI